MAQQSSHGSLFTWLILGAGGFLVYRWWEGQQTALATATAAPAAPATPAAGVVTPAGAFTTQLTQQPATPVVAVPVSPNLPTTGGATASPAGGVCADGTNNCLASGTQPPPPVTAPVATPLSPAGGCGNTGYNTLATALQTVSKGDRATDAPGNVLADAPTGYLNGWQWDWHVVNNLNGKAIVGASYNEMATPMSACDYVALRAKYGATTGLSGMARLNVPFYFRRAR